MVATSRFPSYSDDEEFADDGVDDARRSVDLSPVGDVRLPNGTVYKPRTIAGFEDVAWLRRCREIGEHVLSYGPPGTGKTAWTTAAFSMDAVRVDPDDEESPYVHEGFETIVCSADTIEADFLGTFVQDPESGRFTWSPGPLQRAVEHGVPIYVDEVTLADPRILTSVLYPLMDGRKFLRIPANPTLPPIPVPEGFFVVGSGNPDVPGAVLSEALRDRFVHHVEINTDWQLAAELGVPGVIIRVAKNLDAMRQRGALSWSPQLRALLAYRDAARTFGKAYAAQALIGKSPAQERAIIADAVRGATGYGDALALGGRYGI